MKLFINKQKDEALQEISTTAPQNKLDSESHVIINLRKANRLLKSLPHRPHTPFKDSYLPIKNSMTKSKSGNQNEILPSSQMIGRQVISLSNSPLYKREDGRAETSFSGLPRAFPTAACRSPHTPPRAPQEP